MRTSLFVTAAFLAAPAYADVSPLTVDLDPVTVTVTGEARGAVFGPDLPKAAGAAQHWTSGEAVLGLGAERIYDSGLTLGLKTSFEVLRDRLSSDNYGGNFVQKVYGVAQTGLGRFEIGMADGAAYALSVTGPVVDEAIEIDNPNTSFYIDPSTGRPFSEVFNIESEVESSLNYAKLSYFTPRLFGLQLAVSYTPSEGREVIPFLSNGPHGDNRQKSIWETAVSYTESFEDFSLKSYGALAVGHGDGKDKEDAGLTDWGFGAEIDVPLGEELKWAFGGGYRRANTVGFEIYEARKHGNTESAHLSSTLTWDALSFGVEYGRGTEDGGLKDSGKAAPIIGVKAWQVDAGYQLTSNILATAGWQQMRYDRNIGSFYDGSSRIAMNAVFFHLKFKVPGGGED